MITSAKPEALGIHFQHISLGQSAQHEGSKIQTLFIMMKVKEWFKRCKKMIRKRDNFKILSLQLGTLKIV